MIIDLLKQAILSNVGPLKSSPAGWLKRNCMMCHSMGHNHDSRQRLGFLFTNDTIAINCFNCGFTAAYIDGHSLSNNFKTLLRHINLDEKFINEIDFEIFKNINEIRILHEGDNYEERQDRLKLLIDKWQPTKLPIYSQTLQYWIDNEITDSEFLDVLEYAINRKLYDFDKLYWTPNTEFNFNKRLIIPYYYKNKIVGYTGRLNYEDPTKTITKYYNVNPTGFIYNLDAQQDYNRKYIIVTEGVLDAFVIDGISILGECGQTKIDMINRLNKKIIVCPDIDSKGMDLIDIAVKNDWLVSFPNWDSNIKDAAAAAQKYGRLLTLYSIIKSAEEGQLNITLKARIRENERQRKRSY